MAAACAKDNRSELRDLGRSWSTFGCAWSWWGLGAGGAFWRERLRREAEHGGLAVRRSRRPTRGLSGVARCLWVQLAAWAGRARGRWCRRCVFRARARGGHAGCRRVGSTRTAPGLGSEVARPARAVGSTDRFSVRKKCCSTGPAAAGRSPSGSSCRPLRGRCVSDWRTWEVTAGSSTIWRCVQGISTWRAWGSRQVRHCTMPSWRE